MKTRQSTKSAAVGGESSSSFNKKRTPANDFLRQRKQKKSDGGTSRIKITNGTSLNKKSIVLQNKSPQSPDNNNGNNNNNDVIAPEGNNNNNNLPPRQQQQQQVGNLSPIHGGTPIQLVTIPTEKPKTPLRRSIRKPSTSTPKTNPKLLSTPTTKSINKKKSDVRRSLAFSDKDEHEKEEEQEEGDDIENINLMRMKGNNEASPNLRAGKNKSNRFVQLQDDSNSDDGSPKFHLAYDKNIA